MGVVFSHLQIYDPWERRIVGILDAGLSVGAAARRLLPARRWHGEPARILMLRLERIGDLMMTLDAIAAVRAFAPSATIDLAVGSWNEPLARLIPGIDRVETLDAPWLARGGSDLGLRELVGRALAWRSRRYDLAINFEGDIRSNLLLALFGARRRAGFGMAGGGPVLTDPSPYDPKQHVSLNAWRLVERTFTRRGSACSLDAAPVPGSWPKLRLPDEARRLAADLLNDAGRGTDATDWQRGHACIEENLPGGPPLVGVHASGGREIKQWDSGRLSEVATRLAHGHGATIVLTGSAADRGLVARVSEGLPHGIKIIDLAGKLDLVLLGAVLERLDVFVTADTGPMHLAAAMGTPIAAIFGPSDPARYTPLAPRRRIIRVDLPCSPCNRIRRPPARCVGHLPDCLGGVTTNLVVEAVDDLLREVNGGTRRRTVSVAPEGRRA